MATRSKSRGIQQLAPDDWIHAAIEGLLKHGAQGARIARLARELGVTPGSFYWHFRDRNEFRDRILEYWMNQMLVRAASAAGHAGKGARQLRALPDILVDRELPD
jgi:AcrR family transcriptional regulator